MDSQNRLSGRLVQPRFSERKAHPDLGYPRASSTKTGLPWAASGVCEVLPCGPGFDSEPSAFRPPTRSFEVLDEREPHDDRISRYVHAETCRGEEVSVGGLPHYQRVVVRIIAFSSPIVRALSKEFRNFASLPVVFWWLSVSFGDVR